MSLFIQIGKKKHVHLEMKHYYHQAPLSQEPHRNLHLMYSPRALSHLVLGVIKPEPYMCPQGQRIKTVPSSLQMLDFMSSSKAAPISFESPWIKHDIVMWQDLVKGTNTQQNIGRLVNTPQFCGSLEHLSDVGHKAAFIRQQTARLCPNFNLQFNPSRVLALVAASDGISGPL